MGTEHPHPNMSNFAMKWGKKNYEVTIDGTTSPATLMQQVEQLTGVPITNQKLMAKKGWKGVLSNDTKLKVKPGKTTLPLMGSDADTINSVQAGPSTITFVEDMSTKTETPVVIMQPKREREADDIGERLQKTAKTDNSQHASNTSTQASTSSVPTGVPQRVPQHSHSKNVTSVAFNHSGTQIVSGSEDGVIKVWDSKNEILLFNLEDSSVGRNEDSLFIHSVAFSPDESMIVSCSGEYNDSSVNIWDTNTRKLLSTINVVQDVSWSRDGSLSVAFSPDSSKIASRLGDGTANIWDSNTGNHLLMLKRKLGNHQSQVLSIAFSPDASMIVAGSDFGDVIVWDTKTGNNVHVLKHGSEGILSVSFTPDALQIVSASEDSTVIVWDTKTGKCVQTDQTDFCIGSDGFLLSVALNHDASKVVSHSGESDTISVWDIKTKKLTTMVESVDGTGDCQKTSSAFNHDASQIVTGSSTTVKVWDTKTGKLLSTLEDPLAKVPLAEVFVYNSDSGSEVDLDKPENGGDDGDDNLFGGTDTDDSENDLFGGL